MGRTLAFIFVWLIPLHLFSAEVRFEKAKIKIQGVTVHVEVAKTPEQLSRGLMFRQKLGKNSGMLFVYESEQTLSFWMKNTFIPLSIGFFSKDKKLVDVQEMSPVKSEMQKDIPTYQSKAPAKYALEMPSGWFQKNKIKMGSRFEMLP